MKKSRLKEMDVRHNNGSFFANISEDAKHDELVERALMRRKMEARKKAELKLFRLDLMKRLVGK